MPQPKLLSKPWASDGLKNNIPAERNGGLAQEAATYAEGFPSITMTPISVGGKPPSGKDMNGVLHEISAHTVWQNQGGRYRFDQTFCDAIGGYPKGAVLINDTLDTEYISLVDANTHNPNSGNNTGKWEIHAGKGLKASTIRAGIVQLSSATNSDREDVAATSKAVKIAYDKAEESAGKGLPVGAVIGFPRAVTNPEGYLKADGSTFAQATYPDLHRVLGSNKLPNLTRSDIGMTAYFAFDDIPDGWIKYDEIATKVTQSAYPELYRKLVAQYGSIDAVPKAEDRFIRNVSGSLMVGAVQEDMTAEHIHGIGLMSGADDALFIRKRWGSNTLNQYNVIQINGQLNRFQEYDISPLSPNGAFPHYLATAEDERSNQNGETRPKAIAMVLCIKAKDSLDDVVMWVKAYGKVTNAGVLDAATLAAGLQNKSDKGHTHRAAEINDFSEAVAALTVHQKIGTFDICKLPDGTQIESGTVRIQNHNNNPTARVLTWPLAFVDAPVVVATMSGPEGNVRDIWVTIDNRQSNQSAVHYWLHEPVYNTPDVTVNFVAIGRWK